MNMMSAPVPQATAIPAARVSAGAILTAAKLLLPQMADGEPLPSAQLRKALEAAFGASDASGAWDWKTVYETGETACVLFLRKYGRQLFQNAATPLARLTALTRIAELFPTHTRRSEESQAFQQFSTPLPLALAAVTAAQISASDHVLEPSAGTGLLAILAEICGAALTLNELAEERAELLTALFPASPVSRHDAAQINDHLNDSIMPSVVLMNPPFSVMANVSGRVSDAALRHIASALARLQPGGRLVAITGAGLSPDSHVWAEAFDRLQSNATVVFSAAINGSVYARHGTTTATRLTVIEKRCRTDADSAPALPGIAPDVATLLDWIALHVPPRPGIDKPNPPRPPATGRILTSIPRRKPPRPAARAALDGPVAEVLTYEVIEQGPPDTNAITDAIYEEYRLQTLTIPGAQPHPTKLVQSAAMASVTPPKPSYRPTLPTDIREHLSAPQLETVIFAGEAHSEHLAGHWRIDKTYDQVSAAPDDAPDAVRFRRGFMLGDGTGAGKGRQSAGIILDNWLQGRRKAVWISKSDKLIEDAQRDWAALGMERLLVTPLSRFAQGKPVNLPEGILFTTYATLRSEERGEKCSRLQQVIDWLGAEFDGVIIFDESHAMQNAAGGKGERGDIAASQQGRAGLRLQHALPDARVVYVSATGATHVHNLAYAQRLGLWGGEDFPFANRSEFVTAIEGGGVAAMEVLARDLRALGLYTARSLSYDGVEYELLEHQLTDDQVAIYDAYAEAFAVIHQNLDAAMEAANITGSGGTMNGQAKSAARSAFESAKQRFFGHLLTSMKTPTLIRKIESDLEAGHSSVIQIVSTGEALMERRLANVLPEEWNDVRVDITPREYVLDYLAHSFPTQLYEPYSDEQGNVLSRPVYRDGQPVECRAAVARRDEMIERLAALTPVPGALDQIVQRFGTDIVAEVTGRSRRIVRKGDRLCVENRPGSANLSETSAFMDDQKRILIFSDAGGTGRSYHAELSARNQRLRVHYLLEPGWKADAAIQGLGRTNRTNQAQPPLFRPIATTVKAEKRFLSTIARRLDTLGAITRGQRQTGGQNLFRPEDNLESTYARDALRQLYLLLVRGRVEGCSLQRFESQTGLRLTDSTGIREELPPINTFLNRLLALTIDLQGILFTAFEHLLEAKVAGAIAAGTYDTGLETLTAESFVITNRSTIYVHPATGAETRLLTLTEKKRNHPIQLGGALAMTRGNGEALLINDKSGRAAVKTPAPSIMLDDGEIERRVRLVRPMDHIHTSLKALADSNWREASEAEFTEAWLRETAAVPEFSETTLHIVSGLLLPVWKRLPNESTRVYRLQTDDGERIIGRRVSAAWAATATVTSIATTMSGEAVYTALLEGKTSFDLAEGLQLRRVKVMAADRIELTGYAEPMRERLKAFGLFTEIISWKLRFFVPVSSDGPEIVSKLIASYPIERITERSPN
ncbi:strawberry notch family protein [Asticcacaulis excentricus]|uniref:Probably methylase n=1 Tax=Asticcacaulis excentricus TaxID=78587 RepID=A0A3G9G5N4_9CAUL|nr:strawberry notch family protein [Asticcacaulis excentricus]BBF82612.1 probably methylase [Asticcacaulis excentricus]